MEDLVLVDVGKGECGLDEPVEDDLLGEVLALLLVALDVEGEVAL